MTNMTKSNDQFLNFYRGSLRMMLDMMKVPLTDAKRLHTRQLKALSDALSDQAEKAKQIAAATTFEDLLKVQMELARAQMKEAMLYWSGVGEMVNWNAMNPMEQLQGQTFQMGDGFREMLGMVPAGMEPVASMWKSMVDSFFGACAVTSRATTDVTRLAADQVGLATTLTVPEESGHHARHKIKAA